MEKDDDQVLSQEDHDVRLRLRSGHNRLNNHMATRMRLVPSPLCPRGLKYQTVDRILHIRSSFNRLRNTDRPAKTPLETKLYRPRQELERSA